MPDDQEQGSGKGFLSDFKSDKAKWLGVAIAAASLGVAYLIYKRGQSQQQASASSVFPVAGSTGDPTASAPDLAGQLGNLISMISAQNAQTQSEIAALTSQQAQQQAASAASGTTVPVTAGAIWLNTGPQGIASIAGMPSVPRTPKPAVTPVGTGGTSSLWSAPVQEPRMGVSVKPSMGVGGPEGVGPHWIGMPNGFTQHEFAPSEQVTALRGGRQPYVHV